MTDNGTAPQPDPTTPVADATAETPVPVGTVMPN